uniref:Uncharacterized protein n=1 Tax=Acrobeloides nanus TaxID=290746 RepID=A0A914CLU7_9BILA
MLNLKKFVKLQQVPPPELKFYESQAHVLNEDSGRQIARLGYTGTYLSERCHITYETDFKISSSQTPNFVHAAFVEVDLSAIAQNY